MRARTGQGLAVARPGFLYLVPPQRIGANADPPTYVVQYDFGLRMRWRRKGWALERK
jgi:hypothetical protein